MKFPTFEAWAAIVVAFPLTVALVCRFAQIGWRTHRWDVVAYHLALLVYCGAVATDALDGAVPRYEWLGLVAAALWLRISWGTAQPGEVPEHAITRPAALEPTPLRVVGQRWEP